MRLAQRVRSRIDEKVLRAGLESPMHGRCVGIERHERLLPGAAVKIVGYDGIDERTIGGNGDVGDRYHVLMFPEDALGGDIDGLDGAIALQNELIAVDHDTAGRWRGI